MWEIWVRSLGWEDPLEEVMATHFSILACRIPLDRGAWQAAIHGVTESYMSERLSTAQRVYIFHYIVRNCCHYKITESIINYF